MHKEKTYLVGDSQRHQPPFEIFRGNQDPHPERPSREVSIKKALADEGYPLESVNQMISEGMLLRVHSQNYIQFLKETATTLNPGEYQYPSVFHVRASKARPTNRLAMHGYYSLDTYTPLSTNTYEIALQSATLSWTLAQALANEQLKFGYALCRPPGHHAERSYCRGIFK
jgi:acetoin utilization deacetylase AcuC-like enzyme